MKNNYSNLELQYNLLLEQCQGMVLFFQQDGKILSCNTLAFDELGYGDDIYHMPIQEIFSKDINLDLNLLSKNDIIMNTIVYRENQTCFPVKLKIAIIEKDDEFLGICTLIDRSEYKELQHILESAKYEAEEAKRIKNEFLANITHELRTPVNGIIGLTENLLDSELSPKQTDAVNIIHRCCLNMTKIIDDILDFSKFINGKLLLEQEVFDFREFINNIISFNINKISEKGLKLYVNIDNNIPKKVIGDEHRLTQILNNLFSNAIKFTSVGQIALEIVKTAQTDTSIELFFVLMDTGIGISPEEQDKLFQSFSQVDGSITRRFGGTGLGLAICKQLVELMHGTITVDSEKSKGSTFSFSIRLGIQENALENYVIEPESKYISKEDGLVGNLDEFLSSETDFDYIGKIIEKAMEGNSEDNWGSVSHKYSNQTEFNQSKVIETLEKIAICVEMESWEKAEDFAGNIKNMLQDKDKQLQRAALGMLLQIRKEDHDQSLIKLNKLKELLKEVK